MSVLGDYVKFANGGTPPRSRAELWNGDIPWITGADIAESGSVSPRAFISHEAVRSSSTQVLPAGTVLVLTRTAVGKVGVLPSATAINQDITAVTPSKEMDTRFLVWFLRAGAESLAQKARGATIKGVTRADVASMPLNLPPTHEQRRIAAILDRADAVRTKRRKLLSHLDSLAQAVFNEMFAVEHVRRPFFETCTRVTVGVVVKPASYYVETGVPALRTLNVRPGSIELDDLVYFSATSNDGPLAKSRLRVGDLLIARTGRPGTAAVVPEELDGANAIDLIIASPDPNVALPVYLEAFMNSGMGKRIVSGEARGQIQQHFNVGSLKRSVLPVPGLDLQREFGERVQQINKLRRVVKDAGRQSDALFASLQARAFRGEL